MTLLLGGFGEVIQQFAKADAPAPTYTLVGVNDQYGSETTLVAGRTLKEIEVGFNWLRKNNQSSSLGHFMEVRMWLNGISVNYISHLNEEEVTEHNLKLLFDRKYS